MSRRRNRKFWLVVFIIGAIAILGYLFWKYAIPIIVIWFNVATIWLRQNSIPIILSLIVIFALTIFILVKYIRKPPILEILGRTQIPINIQREVIRRADGRCQWKHCFEKPSHMHHIDKNPSNHSLSNILYLCPNCHERAHRGEARTFILRDWAQGRY